MNKTNMNKPLDNIEDDYSVKIQVPYGLYYYYFVVDGEVVLDNSKACIDFCSIYDFECCLSLIFIYSFVFINLLIYL